MNVLVCLGLFNIRIQDQPADVPVYTGMGQSVQGCIAESSIGRPYDLVYDHTARLFAMTTALGGKLVIKWWGAGDKEPTEIPLPVNTSIQSRFFKQNGRMKLLAFHKPTERIMVATFDPTVRDLILDSEPVSDLTAYDRQLAPKEHDRAKAALRLLHWGSPNSGPLDGPTSIPTNNVNAVNIDTLIAGTTNLGAMAMESSTGAPLKVASKTGPTSYVQFDVTSYVEQELDRNFRTKVWDTTMAYTVTANSEIVGYGMTSEAPAAKWFVVWLTTTAGHAPIIRSITPGLLARTLKSFD
jgi:hypothetical protein